MPATSSCISCQKPFAGNRELAAIPDASKVAFDPAHRRVWRICASCGEWNLLGAEAAAAALPELEARFAAVTSSSAPELGFAPARVSGRLELLRVGRADLVGQDDGTAVRLRKEVDKRTRRMKWFWPFAAVVFVAWIVFTLVFTHGSLSVVPIMVFMYGVIFLIQHVVNRLRGKAIAARSWIQSCGAVLGGLALIFASHQQEQMRYELVGLAVVSPLLVLMTFFESHYSLVSVRLLDGTKLRLSQANLAGITLSWTPGKADLSLHDFPKGRSVTGADVAGVFRRAIGFTWKGGLTRLMVTLSTITENAYNLLSTVGGLPGLLHALEGFRRDNDGRVLIADLPMVYLVALDLALSDKGAGSGSDALRDKAIEAAAVANEAEELDRR